MGTFLFYFFIWLSSSEYQMNLKTRNVPILGRGDEEVEETEGVEDDEAEDDGGDAEERDDQGRSQDDTDEGSQEVDAVAEAGMLRFDDDPAVGRDEEVAAENAEGGQEQEGDRFSSRPRQAHQNEDEEEDESPLDGGELGPCRTFFGPGRPARLRPSRP